MVDYYIIITQKELQDMKYYLASLSVQPVITFAHGYRTENYQMTFLSRPCFFEIAYLESGDIIREFCGERTVFREKSLVTFPHDKEFSTSSVNGFQHHLTVGIALAEPLKTISADEIASRRIGNNEALLPESISPGSSCERCEKLLRQIIGGFSSADAAGNLMELSALFGLFAEMTQQSIADASSIAGEPKRRENLYCRRAREYISRHIGEKIRVSDIAAFAGISYGYLSAIFAAAEGVPLVDYINRLKIARVRELITTRRISLEDAGVAVGIDDVKYLSRIFKKYNGITSAEYRKLHVRV